MEEIDSLKSHICIQPTWKIDSGYQDLNKSIKFSSSKSCSLEDLVQIESCVHLSSNEVDEPFSIIVKLEKSATYLISGFSVVSEARIIECFGELGEYCCTVHADYMDDFEGCAVYSASSELPLSSEITLKFAKMKHENKMWLYGLMFSVEQATAPQMSVAGINLLNVNQILKDSSRPLSEKAESCKKFLQQCSSTSSSVKVPDPQILMKMLEGEYRKSFGETSRNLSKCISNILPFLANKPSEKPDDSCAGENNQPSEVVQVNSEKCEQFSSRQYIDQRFEELEQKLTDKIDEKFKELEITQNQKLDTIIKLLERR
ncbi:hypothetical protein LSTR_LSTR007529 [Laodelphax striatellus]|uniref:Uncharacterized protein n=1 Tax=Laodelphax striatellus TaxID=195883 RepID=A0A482XQX0_LAOST|nr:hypothetical protein LSTR_LSTR007529 [Laodelphax striatellus]